MNYLYAHGTRECVSDEDTMNIYGVSSPPHACIPNYMHPMHFVPQLATGINHSQPLLITYCAFDSLIAIISMYQVAECMTRIWSVAMAYRCPICVKGIVYVPGVYWTSVGH